MRVLVFGTFDTLHPGHEYFLKKALSRGELWVVVACDETVQKIKGKKPSQTQKERIQSIQSVFSNAHVVSGDAENYLRPVEEISPELILLGYDQKLPPGVRNEDLPCLIERLEAYRPEQYKSSILRGKDEKTCKK